MVKCSDKLERWYFQSRCFDEWKECVNGDDEDQYNKVCNPSGTTTTLVPPDYCNQVTVSGTEAKWDFGTLVGVYNRVGTNEYEGE